MTCECNQIHSHVCKSPKRISPEINYSKKNSKQLRDEKNKDS